MLTLSDERLVKYGQVVAACPNHQAIDLHHRYPEDVVFFEDEVKCFRTSTVFPNIVANQWAGYIYDVRDECLNGIQPVIVLLARWNAISLT